MKNLGILSFVAILLFSLAGCAERKVVVESVAGRLHLLEHFIPRAMYLAIEC